MYKGNVFLNKDITQENKNNPLVPPQMGYKLIIVDDEKVIRDMLYANIDWSDIGFDVVDILEDGKDAIEYIENNPVDVILTDIRMTFVSGLELAEYVYNNKLDIKLIFLSGHEDFEYARQAMRFGVKSYLLKPILVTEIIQTFTSLKKELDIIRKEEEDVLQKEKQYEELLPLLRKQFFVDLSMGAIRSIEEIALQNKLLNLNIDINNSKCCVINLKLHDIEDYLQSKWKYGKEGLYTAIYNIVQTNKYNISSYLMSGIDENMQIFAFCNSSKSIDSASDFNLVEFKSCLDEYIKNVKQELEKNLSIEVVPSMGSIYDNIIDFSENKSNSTDFKIVFPDSKRKMLISYINTGNFEMAENIIDNIFSEGTKTDIDIRTLQTFVAELFTMLYYKLEGLGIKLSQDIRSRCSYDSIMYTKSVSEIHSECRTLIAEIVQFIKERHNQSEEQLMKNAKEYIEKHCCEDITLDNLADYVYLSPAYFSRLFKDKTGENFIDYLIKMRMEKAIELLNDRHNKVYAISEKVGYKSLRHFYKLFKQYTGLTPTEYRKNISG